MLELVQITKRFNLDPSSQPAVDHVDLQIREGEFFSLLGPSGCGKTTLLRMLAGFESPTSGQIFNHRDRVDTLPPNERPFNLVFQRYALFPHLNVLQNIEFGLRIKKLDPKEIKSRTDEVLALVKLEGYEAREIATLSGGQQQRVALARALVNRPRVLLLDEPLSALDLKLRQQMQIELRAIQRRLKHTFIFVTHDQEEAMALSDRIAVMNDGRVEQVGEPRQIYDRPETLFVANFIGTANLLESVVHEVTSEGEVILKNPLATVGKASWHGQTVSGTKLDQSFKSGQKVQLVLRPEKLELTLDIPTAESSHGDGTGGTHSVPHSKNYLRVHIKDALFQGATTHYYVQPEGKADLFWTISVPNREGSPSLVPVTSQAHAIVSWNWQDARVLLCP